jgi:uncharacterized protein YndB with AHSA1/START domain
VTVVSVETDVERSTVTVIADFDASVERVWGLWEDPRRLERWWGPPGYPATFETLELVPGGEARYFMTGPDGQRHRGMWRVTAIDPPMSIQFDDIFVDPSGQSVPDVPVTRVSIQLAEQNGGTRMVVRSTFESSEDLERWLSTGTREGQQQSIAQMDELLRG